MKLVQLLNFGRDLLALDDQGRLLKVTGIRTGTSERDADNIGVEVLLDPLAKAKADKAAEVAAEKTKAALAKKAKAAIDKSKADAAKKASAADAPGEDA